MHEFLGGDLSGRNTCNSPTLEKPATGQPNSVQESSEDNNAN